jgi:hypothetical protein
MKQFLKENSYQSIRMMLYQVAMTIFALMLIFAVTVYGDKSNATTILNDSLLAIVSGLSILFYLYLLYYLSYEMGQKDGLRIKGGRMHLFRWKGFFISLIANIPNLLLGLLEFIGKAAIEGNHMFTDLSRLEVVPSPEWAVSLTVTCHTIARFIQGMYIGVGTVFFNSVGFFDLLIPLPAIVVCTVAYLLGIRYAEGFFQHNPTAAKRAKDSRYQ